MNTKIFSATTIGVDAFLVEVEVDLSLGMLQFFIVGLPDAAIKESKQRVITALKNCGIRLPERKITVNLAPADLKKEGTFFDLPIALGILCAAQVCTASQEFLDETIVIGELSLDGSIRPVQGVLPVACDILKMGKKRLLLPALNTGEAALIKGIEVVGISPLNDLIAFLRGEKNITPARTTFDAYVQETSKNTHDFSDVLGQFQAKREYF